MYNTLLRLYVTLGHTFTPSLFLTEMKESGVDPNRVRYDHLTFITAILQYYDFNTHTEVLGCKSVPLVLAGFKAHTDILILIFSKE